MKDRFDLTWLREDLAAALPEDIRASVTIEIALKLAYEAHKGQMREDNNGGALEIPYIVHPVGVAKLCAEFYGTVEIDDDLVTVIATALLHDTLEDTALEIDDIAGRLSSRVAFLVMSMTKPPSTSIQSRDARNRRIIAQIREAGPTAHFIKLCDALHNLSRPQITPPRLLAKAVAKARRDYLPLANDRHLGTQIRKRLEQSIARADAVAASADAGPPNAERFGPFIRHCLSSARGKVLEVHDILDILLTIPGLSFCYEGRRVDFVQDVLKDWLGAPNTATLSALSRRLSEDGDIRLTGPPFSADLVRRLGYDRLLAIYVSGKNEVGGGAEHVIFLGCAASLAPEWVDRLALQAATNLLAERYLHQRASELSEFASYVRLIDLDIDPACAAASALSQGQLLKLRDLQHSANASLSAVIWAVERLVDDAGVADDILIQEHRIKQAESIVQKAGHRKEAFTTIADVIGVRLVFSNRAALNRLANASTQGGDGATAPTWLRGFDLVDQGVVLKDVDTVQGYHARHLCFTIHGHDRAKTEIGCEVQLRTIFEDAWARASHALAYHHGQRIDRKKQKALRNLSSRCTELDTAIDALFIKDE